MDARLAQTLVELSAQHWGHMWEWSWVHRWVARWVLGLVPWVQPLGKE